MESLFLKELQGGSVPIPSLKNREF